MPVIDFYYDFVSPYSYMAATQVPDFAKRYAVKIEWLPMLLPQLMKLADNRPPATIPKKGLYLLRDLHRWAEYLDVPFKMQNPPFFDARPALMAAQALGGNDRERFSLTVFNALWSGVMKPDHDSWLRQILAAAGLPEAWAVPKGQDVLMAQLRENTRAAFQAGAFGAPSFVLRGAGKPRLFWGVDRMDFLGRAVDEALTGSFQ